MTIGNPRGMAGGVVSAVSPNSIAEECGILRGDHLMSVDGQTLRDVIDYRFLSATAELTLLYSRGAEQHEVTVEKDWDEELGIEFESPVFDGIRRCRNSCVFCFVKNLPQGLRQTLYIKDDDYRLSFLFGNFITLSILGKLDFDRIEEQKLSPLYVSVHATERQCRNRLLGVEAPDILEQIDELGRRRIQINAQVVLNPGVNDGAQLERTIIDLSARHQTVSSTAVVPVGLTRFCRNGELRTYNSGEAREIVGQVTRFQKTFRKTLGRTFVHLSDEFYVMSGVRVPGYRWYDGFPQLENGIGLVRQLLSCWATRRRRLPAAVPRSRRVGWVCGVSAYSTLSQLAGDFNRVDGLHVEVYPVPNRFFGTTVTVSGLLTGADVLAALRGQRADEWVLPRVMFDASGEKTLDGMTLADLRQGLADPVGVAGTCEELLGLTLLER